MLLTHLTVRETLDYATELGVGKTLSAIEKRARVEEVVELMGLQECADVMIGNSEKSGCSGGQRRRVSIGMQLVNEPACLFLDEPTSGLDALTGMSSSNSCESFLRALRKEPRANKETLLLLQSTMK